MNFQNIENLPYIAAVSAVTLLGFLFYAYRRRLIMRRVSARLVLSANSSRSRKKALVKEILIVLSLAFAALAMLAPQWGETMREVRKDGTDFLVVMDVSYSMYATDIKPTRLDRAKNAVRLVADSLTRDRAGMVVFAGSAFLQCPLTTDIGAFSMFLDSASPSSVRIQGTDIGKALEVAARVFEKKRTQAKMLFLITDGEDHENNVEAAVAKLKGLGVSVYTAGIGSETGGFVTVKSGEGEVLLKDRSGEPVRTKVNVGLLKKIAEDTGGKYIDINNSLAGVESIISAIHSESRTDFGSRLQKELEPRFYIPAALFLLLMLAELIISDRKRIDK
jgi:Ca-activated chloride channel family protein